MTNKREQRKRTLQRKQERRIKQAKHLYLETR